MKEHIETVRKVLQRCGLNPRGFSRCGTLAGGAAWKCDPCKALDALAKIEAEHAEMADTLKEVTAELLECTAVMNRAGRERDALRARVEQQNAALVDALTLSRTWMARHDGLLGFIQRHPEMLTALIKERTAPAQKEQAR